MDIIIDLVILIGLLVLGVPVPFCFMAAVLFLWLQAFIRLIQWLFCVSFFLS